MPIENVYEIDVDIKQKTAIRTPTVTQNDAVVFIFRIFDEGRIYNIQDGSTFTMTSTRSDKEAVMTIGEVIGENIVQFELGTTEIAVIGKVESVIQVYDVAGRVSTIPFCFTVLKDPSGDFIPSEDEQTLIQKVLGEGPAILTEAQKVSTETAEAEVLRVTAENNRVTAESERVTSETNRTTAENGRATAEQLRIQSETDRQTAETARVQAEEARQTNISTAISNAESATTGATEATNAINLVLPNAEGLGYVEPFNASTNYVKNNIVSYEGSSYIALRNTVGSLPTNNEFWGLLARKGTDGLGSVVTVNGIEPDEHGNVSITIPAPDLSGLATKQEVSTLEQTVTSHLAENVSDGVHGLGRIASKDYEEGMWTPTLAGETTAGVHTYTIREGRYTKIGNVVNIRFNISISSKDAAMSGIARLSGLPFVANSVLLHCGGVFSSWQGVDLSTNFTALAANVLAGTNYITINQLGDNVPLSSVQSSAFSGIIYLRGQLTYQI